MMKKTYNKPVLEEVNPRLLNVVLGPGIGDWSNGAGGEYADAKERDDTLDGEAEIESEKRYSWGSLW